MSPFACARFPLVSMAMAFATAFLVIGFGRGGIAAPAGAGAIGTLSVSSDPAGAAVYVDGNFVGQTPLSLTQLPVGDHRLRVVRDGYLENGRLVRVAPGRGDTIHVRLTARAASGRGAFQPQANGLRIVVIQGEDSVNIIQQKTAVTTIVEVRDRNDLPVSGASVVFLLGGGARTAALNNGLSHVTLSTNAAGRATVAVSPLSNGAVQIEVQASYAGQTASATITQTNFASAAEAAQAGQSVGSSSASAAGEAAAGGGLGGGLSTTTLAVIGGAAAAGTIAAVKVIGRNEPPTVSSVSAAPIAALLGTNTPIRFSATASDSDADTLTFSWEFGDGATATGANPSHTYTTAGTFTVKVTVSDGKDTAVGQANVTIRTLTGSWRGTSVPSVYGNVQFVYNLTQSGSSITGAAPAVTGSLGTSPAGTITTGGVRGTSPQVSFTATYPPLIPVSFSGDVTGDGNTITGVLNDSGYVNQPITLTRQ